MKNIIITFVLSLTFLNCKAQIERFCNPNYAEVQGAYYKDLGGFRNQYIGTWLYTNATDSLKVVLVNKNEIQRHHGEITIYEDFLVGEYLYIENGVEKVNTLNNININYGNDMYSYNLTSISCIRFPNTYPKCNECAPTERRLRMSLNEPAMRTAVDGFANSFILRAFTEGGVQKLKVWFINESQGLVFDHNGEPSNITHFSLPFGEYILIKQ